jgi:predicted RNase H-like HicB family nuclease
VPGQTRRDRVQWERSWERRFFTPDLKGFTGVGHSIEDCVYQAKWGMIEHVSLLRERGLPVPDENPNPKFTVQNAELRAAA